jgi:putative flippase GtrA
LKRILAHLWLNHQTKVRFVLVGLWNTIFGYLAFVGLDYLFNLFFSPRYVAYMSAAVLANIISILNAYIFHKFVTFRSQARGLAIIPELLRFFSMYLFSFILGLVVLPVFVELFHLDPKIAGALLIPVTTIISYLGHSRFSFRRESRAHHSDDQPFPVTSKKR